MDLEVLKQRGNELRSKESDKSKKLQDDLEKMANAVLAHFDDKVRNTLTASKYTVIISYGVDSCVTLDGQPTSKLPYILKYIPFDYVVIAELIKLFNEELDGYEADYCKPNDENDVQEDVKGDYPKVRIDMYRAA